MLEIVSDIIYQTSKVQIYYWQHHLGAILQQKQAKRLTNLMQVQKVKDSEGKTKTLNTETVPHNLEARRRLQFFTNSLFMHMPSPPPIRKMFSFW